MPHLTFDCPSVARCVALAADALETTRRSRWRATPPRTTCHSCRAFSRRCLPHCPITFRPPPVQSRNATLAPANQTPYALPPPPPLSSITFSIPFPFPTKPSPHFHPPTILSLPSSWATSSLDTRRPMSSLPPPCRPNLLLPSATFNRTRPPNTFSPSQTTASIYGAHNSIAFSSPDSLFPVAFWTRRAPSSQLSGPRTPRVSLPLYPMASSFFFPSAHMPPVPSYILK